jgi:hypothetical protein
MTHTQSPAEASDSQATSNTTSHNTPNQTLDTAKWKMKGGQKRKAFKILSKYNN